MTTVRHTPADVSVVIRTAALGRWPDLLAAVASLRQQTQAPGKVVVVVDHNEQLLNRAGAVLTGATVIANSQPPGASGAMNSGIRAAKGEVVAFLDDDAWATPEWLERLVEPFDDPNVQGVGGHIDPVWTAAPPAWFPGEFLWVVGCVYRGGFEAGTPVRNLIGANMAFRRSVFDRVGGFRTAVGAAGGRFLRCEDTEFCIRLRQCMPDAVLRYAPGAKVFHRVPPGRAGWPYFQARCFAEGRSKAQISYLVGSRDGLSSERSYLLRTLPAGVLRGMSDSLFRHDAAGVRRAGAIVAGLAFTTAGYVTERGASRLRAAVPSAVQGPAGESVEPELHRKLLEGTTPCEC